MKKIFCFIMVSLLVFSFLTAAHAEETHPVAYDPVGVTLNITDDLENLNGQLNFDPYYGAISYDPPLYAMDITYFGMSSEEYDAFMKKYSSNEATDEETANVLARMLPIGTCVATTKTPEDVPALSGITNAVLVGSAEGFNFYYIDFFHKESADLLDPEYAEEAVRIAAAMPLLFKDADFFKPSDPIMDLVGTKISFSGKDLEGNEYKSDELFAANQFTMINIWGTWCGPCVSEMEDLAKLHHIVQESGSGIVGIEYEYSYNEQTIRSAIDLLAEKGVTYPNVLVNEDMDFMGSISSFPTSLFVDKDGIVLIPPIIGVPPERNDRYLAAFEEVQKIASSDNSENNDQISVPNGEEFYRVVVTDQNGPVEGVTIQFCSDDLCEIGQTDASGTAVFEQPEGIEYTVHVLTVPDGYEEDTNEYIAGSVFSDINITLSNAR